MTREHFNEIFYTVMISTRSDKWQLAKYLNISKVTLNKYLRYGVPEYKLFMVLDKLEVYLFDNLGGSKSADIRAVR